MKRINVTKSFLPPIEEYTRYISKIWKNGHITNQGPLLKQFESAMQKRFSLEDFHLVGNGTIALQLALAALDITEGEIITTPFSYVATTSSILWERCEPVFVDIEPNTFCIDPDKIEAAITKRTRAIMPVHVFGFPCDTKKIAAIAKRHNLKVIYDAAHAIGVVHNNKSLLDHGDISVCSFHATKLLHTIEGGCLVVNNKAVSRKVEHKKRFGHHGDDHLMLGINGKASEFQAAMGLCNLKYFDRIVGRRKKAVELYDKLLSDRFERPTPSSRTRSNYAYYPILAKDEKELLELIGRLKSANIFPRRYFYPSLNTLPYLKTKQNCPISENISSRIMCLPLYAGLRSKDVELICSIVNQST